MYKLFKYINSIPQLSEELIYDVINHDKENLSFHKSSNYKIFRASEKLNSWCRENIDGVERVAIQEIHQDLLPHNDIGRDYAINYLIYTGDGKLCHYSTDMKFRDGSFLPIDTTKEISRVYVEPKKWHMLNTRILHGVVGINSLRLALTINIGKDTKYI